MLAFIRCGAKVVFADSRADEPNIDATKIEGLITPRTKVIVPVHYAGCACDMDAIMDIANVDSRVKNGGNFKAVLDDLVNCDFVRRYRARKKKNRESFFQLIDNFTLFHYEFLTDGGTETGDFWTKQTETPKLCGWRGRAFERVCLLHERQIKAALGISGIRTDAYSWRTHAEAPDRRGAQIDLVIERTDGNVNLCEMKYASGEYALSGDEAERLQWRKTAFADETGVRKTLRLTLVTPVGIARNAHAGIVHNVVTLNDLFKE